MAYSLSGSVCTMARQSQTEKRGVVACVAELMEICSIRPLVDCQDTIQEMISSKRTRLENIMEYCTAKKLRTQYHILRMPEAICSQLLKTITGKTTSRVERLFRTVNMRVNVSKWSMDGALNVTKVRLAYYYNGFDA